jgi:tetratricopeptide (TPR) repeat protein
LAAPYFRKVVDLAERILAAEPDRDGARRALLEGQLQLGRSLAFDHQLEAAKEWFLAMKERAEVWSAADVSDLTMADLLASSYRKLADVRKLTGHPDASRPAYLKAIEIGRRIVAMDSAHMAFKGHLAIALDDLAGVEQRGGQIAEAREKFREAEALFAERAASDPDDLDTVNRLLHTQYGLALLERDEHHDVEAMTTFRNALARLQRLERQGRLPKHSENEWWQIEFMKNQIAQCEARIAMSRSNNAQPNEPGKKAVDAPGPAR